MVALSDPPGCRELVPLRMRFPGHRARQVPVFGVEVLGANFVGQADDLLVDRQHRFWNRVRTRATGHRNSLGTVGRRSPIIDRGAIFTPLAAPTEAAPAV